MAVEKEARTGGRKANGLGPIAGTLTGRFGAGRLASARRLAGYGRDLRDPQTWRLASGLVLFAFVLTHFLNHALGLISVEAMEAGQALHRVLWRSALGTVSLYGALWIHAGLALWKLATRHSWRMPPWEAAQIVLGIAIPILLAAHVSSTRGLYEAAGVEDSYTRVLRQLWPRAGWRQTGLLWLVWLHGCIGLHHWLKTRRGYPRIAPFLLVPAVLVPTLGTLGWIGAARGVAELTFDAPPTTPDQAALAASLVAAVETGVWILLGLTLATALGRMLIDRIRQGPALTLPGGRVLRGPRGATLLDIVRRAGLPHVAVCGGRGRCTTCRVLITAGSETLPPPTGAEATALSRIKAPATVRLACQIRPMSSLEIRPLLRVRGDTALPGREAYRWGVERRVTVMFTDLRGFTALAERLYPYDAVFVLDRFYEVMSGIVRERGGVIDKFLGDGVMALFGVEPAFGAGGRDALHAAADMIHALEELNREFAGILDRPLRMGIGLHTGPVVLGQIGGDAEAGLTALGDTVNIASRLETLNKDFRSILIASEAVLQAARLELPGAEAHEVPLRGRTEPLRIAVVREDPTPRDASARSEIAGAARP